MNRTDAPHPDRRSAGPARVTLVAAVAVVLLAGGALLWPEGETDGGRPALLVLDTSGEAARETGVYRALQVFLGERCSRDLDLVVARDLATFRRELARGPDLVLAPDGLALEAAPAAYLPVAVGRRAAPMNLRPRSVLVSRRGAPGGETPWVGARARTVCGDSLTLAGSGVLREAGLVRWPRGLACGPDPYDHGPVLHALRLGAFDHAVVRQWDAERFFASGLLAESGYTRREILGPSPDLVLLVSRDVPRHVRLKCGEALAAVGREPDEEAPADRALRRSLAQVRLDGFNLLLETDFEQVRRKFPGDWLPAAD